MVGFKVEGLGFRVSGLGFRAKHLGLRESPYDCSGDVLEVQEDS